jgi:iron(III) transport system permease protein
MTVADALRLVSRPKRLPQLFSATWLLGGLLVFLLLFLVIPLFYMLQRSMQDAAGNFVGLANYVAYFSHPSSFRVIGNSLYIATVSTAITVFLALLYAFALSKTCLRYKGLFRSIALVPLLTPSLLFAMAAAQLFGNQGYLNEAMMGYSIYGPIGIVMGMVFAHFPHVFIILMAAMSLTDARLYEASAALKAGPIRTFRTVTLPTIKYGLISSIIVSFTLCMTDFGIPKVIGGNYDVLATEIYKQVVGQQNFQVGAVVSMVLLVPAMIAFMIDRAARSRQAAMMTTKAVPYVPKPGRLKDGLALAYCAIISAAMLGMIAVPAFTSFTTFWPYNLTFTLRNYQFDLFAGGGWESFINSVRMAFMTAVIGTALIFIGAYVSEKSQAARRFKLVYQGLAVFPMAVPGLVLGLSYIFFMNNPNNPLGVLYGTLTILVTSTIVHYYTVSHLTAVTALRQLDDEFELVSDSLKMPRYMVFFRVTVPVCMPAILDISIYLFLNAMTTVSAVVFLYSYNTTLASISVINMDDAGEYAAAAAMAMVIVVTCLFARCLHLLVTWKIFSRSQAWMLR